MPILIITVVLVGLELLWTSATMKSTNSVVSAVQGTPMHIRIVPAVCAYALMIAAIWFFAVEPSRSLADAASRGAFLGLVINGVYDMTNYAVFENYSIEFAITDIIAGTAMFAAAAAAPMLAVLD